MPYKFQTRENLKIHENVHHIESPLVSMPLQNIGLHKYTKRQKNACTFSIKSTPYVNRFLSHAHLILFVLEICMRYSDTFRKCRFRAFNPIDAIKFILIFIFFYNVGFLVWRKNPAFFRINTVS